MALTPASFALTAEQLQAINDYVQAQAQAYAQAGEDLEFPEVSVCFSFTAVLGRSVSVRFDGAPTAHEISSFETVE